MIDKTSTYSPVEPRIQCPASALLVLLLVSMPHLCCSFVTLLAGSLFLPLKTEIVPSASLPRPESKLPFRHNISLSVSLMVGTPPQNFSMVLDTGSELSWLRCNQSSDNLTSFDPSGSVSYCPVSCYSSTCRNQTRDFTVPVSCDGNNLCHATLSYADASSSEGVLASDVFRVGSSAPALVFGCMGSVYSTSPEEDSQNAGLLGMNRGSLSIVSQMALPEFSYCISGSDLPGLLVLGESNSSWLLPLNYTPLVQMSTPLPYFDRVAYTVQLVGIKVSGKQLPIPSSVFVPDHTGAGQTMVDSGTQFTFLLGPAYTALRNEFLNQTTGVLEPLDDPNFVFGGAMDLCFTVAMGEAVLSELPSVSLVFEGAEMTVPGDLALYQVPGEVRGEGDSSIHCLSFGNSDLLGVEAYVIGHHHQQNLWMEFDLQKSRMGLGQAQCDSASRKYGLIQ